MRVPGYTTTVTIGGERFSMTTNQRCDATLGEVLFRWGKHGTAGSGLMDSLATALSTGLEHGVPLVDLIEPGLGMCHVPNGRTDDPEIPRARSLVDYVSRRLAIDWLPEHDRARLGVFTLSERVEQAELALPKRPGRTTGVRSRSAAQAGSCPDR